MTTTNSIGSVAFSIDVVQQIVAYVDIQTLIYVCKVHPSFSIFRPTVKQLDNFLGSCNATKVIKDIPLLRLLLLDDKYATLRKRYLSLRSFQLQDQMKLAELIFDWNVPTTEDVDCILERVLRHRSCIFAPHLYKKVIPAVSNTDLPLMKYWNAIQMEVEAVSCQLPYTLDVLKVIVNTWRFNDKRERTLALVMICAGGHEEYLERLLATEKPYNACIDYNLPLRLATFHEYKGIIKRLQETSLSINPLIGPRLLSYHGLQYCALEIAARKKTLDILSLLMTTSNKWLNHQEDANKVYEVLSEISMYNKENTCDTWHSSVVKFILERTTSFPFPPCIVNVVTQAADKNDLTTVKLILKDNRLDKNAILDPALQAACAQSAIECVEYLLKDGRSNPAYRSNSAIKAAAHSGSAACVELLLNFDYEKIMRERAARRCRKRKFSCDPSANEGLALSYAVNTGNEDCTKALMKDPRLNLRIAAERILNSSIRKKSAARDLVLSHPAVQKLLKDEYE